MKETVPVAQATHDEAVLSERVREALGELVGAAKEGLLALSVGVGLTVLTEMLEEEVDEVVPWLVELVVTAVPPGPSALRGSVIGDDQDLRRNRRG